MRGLALAVSLVLVGCNGDGQSTSPIQTSSERALRVIAGQTTDTIGAHLAGAGFEQCRVWQTKLDGSQAKILTPLTGTSGQRTTWAALSFDGRLLGYAGYGERLHILNLQIGADVDLGVNTQAVDIDSAGRRLVYVKDSFNASPLLITNTDGTNPIALAGGRSFSGYAQWLPGEQWIFSRGVMSDSPNSGGDKVLVNVTTGELVPVRYSLPVGELYIVR